jgi:predicted NACHT family NTPase
MTAEDALILLDTVLEGQKLRDVQEQVFRYAWQGWTYPEIANHLGYDTGHIRDVGSELWQQLTQVIGEKVSKNNVQAVLRRQTFQRHTGTDVTYQSPMRRLTQGGQGQAALQRSNFFGVAQSNNPGCQVPQQRAATKMKPTTIGLLEATGSNGFSNAANKAISEGVKQELEQSTQTLKIDSFVRWVREKIYDNVQTRCGSLRVLDMSQPIALEAIYIPVNLFESIQGRQRWALADLLQRWNPESFNHLDQPEVRSGSLAVEQHSKLMIFGKPGAGKTTFLKWLGTQCNHGRLWAHLVPVFITLKAFAEAKSQPGLLSYVQSQWANCGVSDAQAAETLFQQGRALILLDGLDEVREIDHDRVLQEIQNFSIRFHNCRFVITCRVAAQEYTFEQFTEVEIADLDSRQIRDFVTNWFKARSNLAKAEKLMHKLQDNPRIGELATNSLLLTLLCLVFEEFTDFPANRAALYREGLNILLQKWDAKRNIKRDVLFQGGEIYHMLPLQTKEALLSHIAFTTFERGEYCFQQQTVEQSIADFIQRLPVLNASDSVPSRLPSTLIDTEAVLKSIEAQHGLLVERARGIYSFSHLTFQEYFTAKQIATALRSNSPFGVNANGATTQAEEALQNLVSHITQTEWQEVFLLTVGMLPNAEPLLLCMKAQIDCLLSTDAKLQQFLVWLNERTEAVVTTHKAVTARAYYSYLILDSASASTDARLIAAMTSNDVRNNVARGMYFSRNLTGAIAKGLSGDIVEAISNANSVGTAISIAIDIAEAVSGDIDIVAAHTDVIARSMRLAIDRAISLNSNPQQNQSRQVEQSLQALKDQFSNLITVPSTFKQWWKQDGYRWTQQLKRVIVQFRNLEYDWQFTDAQIARLEQYYRANHLLTVCLHSDCSITPSLREEIEATLLLPIVH